MEQEEPQTQSEENEQSQASVPTRNWDNGE